MSGCHSSMLITTTLVNHLENNLIMSEMEKIPNYEMNFCKIWKHMDSNGLIWNSVIPWKSNLYDHFYRDKKKFFILISNLLFITIDLSMYETIFLYSKSGNKSAADYRVAESFTLFTAVLRLLTLQACTPYKRTY